MVKRRLLVVALLAPLTACSLLDWSGLKDGAGATLDAGPVDGATRDADAALDGAPATGDAGTRCDPNAPFGTPVLVPGPINTSNDNELNGFLTPDELTLYFARDRGDGVSFDIYVAKRTDPNGAFGEATTVVGLSSSSVAETTPFLARDGTMFLTTAGSSGRGHIASAKPDGDGGFLAPVEITALSTASAAVADPWFLANGTTFYFTDAYDQIPMTAKAQSNSFTTPKAIPGVPVPADAPKVTDDDLTVFFVASPSAGVETDIYTAHRASPTADFADVQRVVELSTDDRDEISWVSGDGCHVVVSRRGNSTDLYFASRGHL